MAIGQFRVGTLRTILSYIRQILAGSALAHTAVSLRLYAWDSQPQPVLRATYAADTTSCNVDVFCELRLELVCRAILFRKTKCTSTCRCCEFGQCQHEKRVSTTCKSRHTEDAVEEVIRP